MTRSEIHKKLNNTKVYLGKYSKEVQEKLFKLGYSWGHGITYVSHTSKPFLFISTYSDFLLGYSDDLTFFNEHKAKEITVEDMDTVAGGSCAAEACAGQMCAGQVGK